MTENRTRRYAAALAVVIVPTVLNAYALNTFDVVGIPFIFATALGVQLLLIISFAYSLVMVLQTPLKITLSILISAWQGALTNPHVVSLRRRYPRLSRWVGQRFTRERPWGLVLTAGVAATVAATYLNSEPETVAFERPTDANTLVQRHHTRLWKTTFTLDGEPVWVATASFDKGIGIGTKSGLPTHHIDPNVDAERTFILQSLNMATPRFVHVVDAQLGHNATGDGFFTDGQAAVINLTVVAR